jgi:predicted nucleotidyltransferase
MILFSKDMREFVSLLNSYCVSYAIVGGFAVNYYGYVRTTQDIDILIKPSKINAIKIMNVLIEFGFGGAGIPQKAFEKKGFVIHMGVEPNRIDLLTSVKGVSNTKLFSRITKIDYEGVTIPIISFQDLIDCKKVSDRKKDQADVDELKKINKTNV